MDVSSCSGGRLNSGSITDKWYLTVRVDLSLSCHGDWAPWTRHLNNSLTGRYLVYLPLSLSQLLSSLWSLSPWRQELHKESEHIAMVDYKEIKSSAWLLLICTTVFCDTFRNVILQADQFTAVTVRLLNIGGIFFLMFYPYCWFFTV